MSWIAAGFLAVYLTGRERWWALIPTGVLLTIALVSGLSSISGELETGGVFFLGLGATFGLLSLVPTPGGRLKWALIPAGILLAIGVLITLETMPILLRLWPAALILVGLVLVIRNVGLGQGRKSEPVGLSVGEDRAEGEQAFTAKSRETSENR